MGILTRHRGDTDGSPSIRKITVKSSIKAVPDKKSYHLSLRGDSIARLEWLQDRVSSGTQTEVFSNALQIFEALLKEHESGSSFFIKRANQESAERFDLFESI